MRASRFRPLVGLSNFSLKRIILFLYIGFVQLGCDFFDGRTGRRLLSAAGTAAFAFFLRDNEVWLGNNQGIPTLP